MLIGKRKKSSKKMEKSGMDIKELTTIVTSPVFIIQVVSVAAMVAIAIFLYKFTIRNDDWGHLDSDNLKIYKDYQHKKYISLLLLTFIGVPLLGLPLFIILPFFIAYILPAFVFLLLIYIVISLGTTARKLDAKYQVAPISTDNDIYKKFEELCKSVKIDSVKIKLYSSNTLGVNACTYTDISSNSRIVIGTPLLNNMSIEEITGIVAHELGHIHARDNFVSTILLNLEDLTLNMNNLIIQASSQAHKILTNLGLAVGNSITFFGHFMRGNARIFAYLMGATIGIMTLFFSLCALILLYTFIYLEKAGVALFQSSYRSYNRAGEYCADIFSAIHFSPQHLTSALAKLENIDDSSNITNSQPALSSMMFAVKYDSQKPDNWVAKTADNWNEMKSTHPLIYKRIEALKKIKIIN